jgi:hypothetical protein
MCVYAKARAVRVATCTATTASGCGQVVVDMPRMLAVPRARPGAHQIEHARKRQQRKHAEYCGDAAEDDAALLHVTP